MSKIDELLDKLDEIKAEKEKIRKKKADNLIEDKKIKQQILFYILDLKKVMDRTNSTIEQASVSNALRTIKLNKEKDKKNYYEYRVTLQETTRMGYKEFLLCIFMRKGEKREDIKESMLMSSDIKIDLVEDILSKNDDTYLDENPTILNEVSLRIFYDEIETLELRIQDVRDIILDCLNALQGQLEYNINKQIQKIQEDIKNM